MLRRSFSATADHLSIVTRRVQRSTRSATENRPASASGAYVEAARRTYFCGEAAVVANACASVSRPEVTARSLCSEAGVVEEKFSTNYLCRAVGDGPSVTATCQGWPSQKPGPPPNNTPATSFMASTLASV